MDLGAISLYLLAALLTTHTVSIGLAARRSTRSSKRHRPEAVTIIRPVCGVEQYDRGTLSSTFWIDHPNYEIIFCCAKSTDPAVALVEHLIAAHPNVRARLLIGDDRPTANPKLNNLVKGWSAAKSEWIVLADSNVIMPPDYLDRMFAAWTPDTGLVCSPPLGCLPQTFWAEVECAFLNTYQARWQLAADSIGFGFAQGKSMLWQRSCLEAAGGIIALGAEIAEDAAATKIVRNNGKTVNLTDRPFEQPLGGRTAKQVLDRQTRWAKLRRATFARYYIPEIMTGIIPALLCAALAAPRLGLEPITICAALFILWYLAEACLNVRAGWHVSWMSPLAWAVRDLLIPLIWCRGWLGNGFTWRGNEMSVDAPQLATPGQRA